ncbi:hypothetical protein A4D02_17300 [Niastella koreensis]|uniref:Radical SAM domain protein n=2 Tax=Niastella koreensis TaxID=354356 RepID=G8TE40_NIAKG|nr:radical SAM protein [Niastella koreensis]AEV97231.1 Radical SAM domain protein [Niastella koreensis GR20-10]OQP39092.1 hypothetical protein A4D02_17300 [Niastella koreensis]
MKYSQFNSILPFDEHYIMFNTYSNGLLALEPMLKDLIEAARAEGIDNLEEVHPSLFQAMKENGFLIENETDEVEKIKQLRYAIDFNESTYHLTINPTMNCNFKCWYCYETHVKNSRMSEEIIERVNTFLTTQIVHNEKIRSFNLSWFGGEPLLYFYDIVLPIMNHFNKVSDEKQIERGINFTSNGYLINQKMVDVFKKNNVTALQITLDGYGEEHDTVRYVSSTRGSYEKIIENVLLMLKHEIFIRLRINYTHTNIQNCHKIIDDLIPLNQRERQFLMLDFHRVWQDHVPQQEGFISAQIDKFRKAGFTVNSNLSMDNVRNSCYADKKNSAVINYNGDVFKCTARDFTTFKRDGYINEGGEIIWENGSLENRMDIKFKNKPCLSCKLLPVCNGGCSQHAVEYIAKGEEYCIFDHDENKKNEVVRQKIKDLVDFD